MLPGTIPVNSMNDFPGAATGDKLRKFFANLSHQEPRSSARSATPASSNDNTPAPSRSASVSGQQQSSRSSSVVGRAVAKGYYVF
ncbi:hypothetical protein DOTSEDRAFT_73232 [Dothistroma septosporum NZE10]|uniref:Uncharacterized protein n=1 Tax=Dothistroma septosporum (strain NZE10 / CBS 128990) TaxID=675120 RepID=N1PLA8_DOTSN|nr:hypothetical protein DOTSEDRAFT_73232 [Dothistroma septosporum NZE10]